MVDNQHMEVSLQFGCTLYTRVKNADVTTIWLNMMVRQGWGDLPWSFIKWHCLLLPSRPRTSRVAERRATHRTPLESRKIPSKLGGGNLMGRAALQSVGENPDILGFMIFIYFHDLLVLYSCSFGLFCQGLSDRSQAAWLPTSWSLRKSFWAEKMSSPLNNRPIRYI